MLWARTAWTCLITVSPVISTPETLKLVKDAVVLIQGAEFGAQVLVHLECFHGAALHGQVPHLDGQVVTRHHVAPIVAELHVRDAGDDLGEEAAVGWVLWLLKHCNNISDTATGYCCNQEAAVLGL